VSLLLWVLLLLLLYCTRKLLLPRVVSLSTPCCTPKRLCNKGACIPKVAPVLQVILLLLLLLVLL
jgi:hypothetical protein